MHACIPDQATIHAGNRRQRKGRADRRTTELAGIVRNALEGTILTELFPKAQIDVGLQVLQTDGSVLAACLNAAMLAVADAGKPLPLQSQYVKSSPQKHMWSSA